jgi:hypothetical protein
MALLLRCELDERMTNCFRFLDVYRFDSTVWLSWILLALFLSHGVRRALGCGSSLPLPMAICYMHDTLLSLLFLFDVTEI